MMGLLSFPAWERFALEIYCSNPKCKNIIVVDRRMITGLLYCNKKCVEEVQ